MYHTAEEYVQMYYSTTLPQKKYVNRYTYDSCTSSSTSTCRQYRTMYIPYSMFMEYHTPFVRQIYIWSCLRHRWRYLIRIRIFIYLYLRSMLGPKRELSSEHPWILPSPTYVRSKLHEQMLSSVIADVIVYRLSSPQRSAANCRAPPVNSGTRKQYKLSPTCRSRTGNRRTHRTGMLQSSSNVQSHTRPYHRSMYRPCTVKFTYNSVH